VRNDIYASLSVVFLRQIFANDYGNPIFPRRFKADRTMDFVLFAEIHAMTVEDRFRYLNVT